MKKRERLIRISWSGIVFVTSLAVAPLWNIPRTHVAVAAEPIKTLPGFVANFSLPTADGETISLRRNTNLHVLCFLGCECPLARLYGPRLQALADRFQDQGVEFIGINSNVQDSMDDVRGYVNQYEVRFPVAKDFDRRVAAQVGATRTPQVFVIDGTHRILYQGRIDDQYQPGVARSAATTHDLRDALRQAIAGETVARPVTEAVGCLIALPRSGVPSSGEVTYCDQVSRVLAKHCVECHRPGEIGPFALTEYDEVVGWADMMIEVIDERRMPPWHAAPEHGSFLNARHMPAEDQQVLRQWVEAGMPYGDAENLPEETAYVDGWRLPKRPDVVLPMSDRPFDVPAEGVVEYQYYVIDPGFEEDRWIRAVQVVPGNHSVVHHCIAFTRPPDGADISGFGMLAAFVPGQIDSPLPDGYAQKLVAGTKIVLQMHYTPTGKPEQDLTSIGIVFADASEVTHEVYAVGGLERDFEIPPHTSDHVVQGKVDHYPRDGFLLSIIPHMHVRGKSFQLRASGEDASRTLLHVPHYDFNWQHNYRLSEPLDLSTIDDLTFEATYDNSADNPTNPDPAEYVTWGDQTWQEMAVVFLGVAKPLGETQRHSSDSLKDRELADQRNQTRHANANEFAKNYMERFDKNRDGSVTPHELPDSVRMFAFGMLDRNGNGAVSMDEVQTHAFRQDLKP